MTAAGQRETLVLMPFTVEQEEDGRWRASATQAAITVYGESQESALQRAHEARVAVG